MTQLVYDGTFQGLLTAIFEVYERKFSQVRIFRRGHQEPDLFGDALSVITEASKAQRVWKKLRSKLSAGAAHDFYSCYLSELPQIESTMLSFFRHVLATGFNVEKDFGHDDVLRLAQVSRMVFREKHRMEAFVRFQRWADDIYFAHVEPDYNVLPLIAPHFKNRYGDQRWVIYDRKRSYGIMYDTDSSQVAEIEIDFSVNPLYHAKELLHHEELHYQDLWKDYFHHVDIASRKNLKLHLRHVPTRYWKYLTEKGVSNF